MKKKSQNLFDPRVLLTEAGEQQWLDQLLDEAAAQQQREKEHQALAEAARPSAIAKRPRKAA